MKIKLFIIVTLLGLTSLASANYPYKMNNEKVGKIVTKAAFYNGLHNSHYVFGVNNENASVEKVKDLAGIELIELRRMIVRSLFNLSSRAATTKKIQLNTNDEGRVTCYVYLDYSINSQYSPQVLTNIEQYNCKNDQGDSIDKYNFEYQRLESSLIMAGKL